MTAKHTTGEQRQEAAGPALPAGRLRVLADQSRIGFRIKKMGLYYVKGSFSGVHGTVDPEGRSEVVIDAGSLSTRIPPRDWHLRSADFLDVKGHPEIRISADSVERADDGSVVAVAMFELHGQRPAGRAPRSPARRAGRRRKRSRPAPAPPSRAARSARVRHPGPAARGVGGRARRSARCRAGVGAHRRRALGGPVERSRARRFLTSVGPTLGLSAMRTISVDVLAGWVRSGEPPRG
jgi:YceI-like domain